MLGLLSQPKPQSADAAIFTLCDRITNSSLVEDRRAAVLALRGLAHENRELVSSTGLRGLLEVLIKDSHDAAAAKATLETFIVLFNTQTRRKTRNKRYVSPLQRSTVPTLDDEMGTKFANDVSLWLADELLHNEEALKCVLELVETKQDPFTAVYALQLVSAMTANRPIETKQAMIAQGGITPLVNALGSVQEMVREEALLLLTALTANHLDIQKLVAFESGFDKVFSVLDESGGAVFGGRFAEDCLGLLANLIEFNTSNQKLFTQSGYIAQWCRLLQSIIDAQNEGSILREQAVINIECALHIGQLLAIPGAELTMENQNSLSRGGALNLALQIAFGHSLPPPVRVAALMTVASLIDSNATLQGELLAMDVPYYPLGVGATVATGKEPRTIPVPQALLNWAVILSSTHLFDLRAASLECLSSTFSNNPTAKFSFIQDQIDGYGQSIEHNKEDVNLISVVAEYSDELTVNPFRVWFACAIIMRLFMDSPESKDQFRGVTVGDESLGMEVHSLIQAVAGELQSALLLGDPTIALGYLQLLTVWLYDDRDAVNEFTSESSALQALLAHQTPDPLVESLAVIVLGTAYSFCTKDSPVPRSEFHNRLTKTLGRDQYMLLVRKFRQSSTFQNFDPSDMFGAPRNANGNPAVYIDIPFVELMRESIGYIGRAIHANPDIEPSPKVTLELLDDVNASLHKKSVMLEDIEKKLVESHRRAEELEKKLAEASSGSTKKDSELGEQKAKVTQLQTELDSLKPKLKEAEKSLDTSVKELAETQKTLKELRDLFEKQSKKFDALKASNKKAETGINNMTRELFQLQKSKESLEKDTNNLKSETTKLKTEIQGLNSKLEITRDSETNLKKDYQNLQKHAQNESEQALQLRGNNEKLIAKLKETAAALQTREEEENELKSQLSAAKIEAENASNELVSLKNRAATSRKEIELAKAKIESLKREATAAKDLYKDSGDLKPKVESLEAALSREKSSFETAKKDLESMQKKYAALELQVKENDKSMAFEEAQKSAVKVKEENTELLKQVADLKKASIEAESNAQKAVKDAEIAKRDAKAAMKETEGAKTDNEKAKKEIEALKKTVDQSKKDTQKVTKKGAETNKGGSSDTEKKLKEELDEKQEALDGLMVLLDDLTEKKALYKTRLRDLKETVSDSEDDDDGEE